MISNNSIKNTIENKETKTIVKRNQRGFSIKEGSEDGPHHKDEI
jgi:hypothetical protein